MGAHVLLQQGSGPEGSRQSIARGHVEDVTRSLRGGMDGSCGPFGSADEEVPMVRRILLLTVFAIAVAGCANASTGMTGEGAGAASSPAVDQRRVGVYATLIDELAGAESADWRRIYVVTSLCQDPSAPEEAAAGPCDDVLTEAEQAALRDRLGAEQLRFIDDPTPLYDDAWMQGPPRDVVLTLGPIVEHDDEVRVAASYACGGLCGSGTTYVLRRDSDLWTVVGHRGPMWIA
jgi:hypothetical protein